MSASKIFKELNKVLPTFLSSEVVKFIYQDHMKAFITNIETESIKNTKFRIILFTSTKQQLVLMSVDKEIGLETHETVDQFIRIEEGTEQAKIRNKGEKKFRNY